MPSPASGLKTRQALLDVAKHYLGEGNSDVSIQQIAKDAEVSVGSLYTYFKDKRELFEAAAADALLSSVPDMQRVANGMQDPAMGFLAAMLHASKRPQFAPETSRIILTVGPLGFARFDEYFEAPKAAIQASIDAGTAHCDDIEAFVIACSGAYQNLLAHVYVGNASDYLVERVFWPFAQQLGYSRTQYQEVIDYVATIEA